MLREAEAGCLPEIRVYSTGVAVTGVNSLSYSAQRDETLAKNFRTSGGLKSGRAGGGLPTCSRTSWLVGLRPSMSSSLRSSARGPGYLGLDSSCTLLSGPPLSGPLCSGRSDTSSPRACPFSARSNRWTVSLMWAATSRTASRLTSSSPEPPTS